MGWGYQHTPFYIPDPTDPYDLAETAVTHTLYGGAAYAGAWALSGSYPGPGHLGTLWNAFGSRAHVGASYMGTNAFDDTMFALRVYGTPFRIAARALAPVAAAIMVHDLVEGYVRTSDEMGGFASPSSSGVGLSPGSHDYGPFGRHFN